MKLKFKLLKETKTCYRFECRDAEGFTTLYLRKADIQSAGITPENGIIITVEEDKK